MRMIQTWQSLTVGPFSSKACLKWIPSTKMSPQEDQVNHQLTFDNCWELFKILQFFFKYIWDSVFVRHQAGTWSKPGGIGFSLTDSSDSPKIWLFETHKVLAHWSSLPKSLSFQRLSLPGCFKSCGSKRKHWLHWSFSSLHTFLAATQKDWP